MGAKTYITQRSNAGLPLCAGSYANAQNSVAKPLSSLAFAVALEHMVDQQHLGVAWRATSDIHILYARLRHIMPLLRIMLELRRSRVRYRCRTEQVKHFCA